MKKSTILIIVLFLTIIILSAFLYRKHTLISLQNCDAFTTECAENISWTDLSKGYVGKLDKSILSHPSISLDDPVSKLTSKYMANLVISSIQKGALIPYGYRQTIFTNNYILVELVHEIHCGKPFENEISYQPYYEFSVIVAIEKNTFNTEVYYTQFDKRWNSNMSLEDYLKIIGKA